MPLQIIHQDITKVKCDAIVNPTDRFYSGGGGTDATIHAAAGPGLEVACNSLPPLECGQVEVTPGYNLPCRHVFHTFGPVWGGGSYNETVLLRSCYMNALLKAKRMGLQSIAFPLISSGTFGFPRDKVLRIAIEAISDFLFTADGDMEVYICIINRNAFELSREIDLRDYLSHCRITSCNEYAPKVKEIRRPRANRRSEDVEVEQSAKFSTLVDEDAAPKSNCINAFVAQKQILQDACLSLPEIQAREAISCPAPAPKEEKPTLDEILKKHDDTFAVLLMKLIDSRGMGDVECYRKANVSRNVFYHIRNDKDYRPSKQTVIAFAIALELTLDETEKLLKSGGLALAGNNDFDLIIEYYIENGIYDVYEINEALFKYDQVPLGCSR